MRLLRAIEAAADPLRLLEAVQEAVDGEDAVRRIGAASTLDESLARVLLGLPVRQLSVAWPHAGIPRSAPGVEEHRVWCAATAQG